MHRDTRAGMHTYMLTHMYINLVESEMVLQMRSRVDNSRSSQRCRVHCLVDTTVRLRLSPGWGLRTLFPRVPEPLLRAQPSHPVPGQDLLQGLNSQSDFLGQLGKQNWGQDKKHQSRKKQKTKTKKQNLLSGPENNVLS